MTSFASGNFRCFQVTGERDQSFRIRESVRISLAKKNNKAPFKKGGGCYITTETDTTYKSLDLLTT